MGKLRKIMGKLRQITHNQITPWNYGYFSLCGYGLTDYHYGELWVILQKHMFFWTVDIEIMGIFRFDYGSSTDDYGDYGITVNYG